MKICRFQQNTTTKRITKSEVNFRNMLSRFRLHVQVPGNLISTAKYLDLLGNVTTANRHIDLRSCRIVRCLALYPADPLPALAFHAPVLPDYPVGCEVEEDATLGCHQACTMALCTG